MKRYRQRRAAKFMVRVYRSSLFGLVLLALLAIVSPERAYADGGAPNLAYVAGTQQGIGIIDVAQRKVARQFSIGGDPSMILLSFDGRLLYVTQPALGRVTALAAKTGQTICSATYPGHPALLALSSDGTVVYAAGLNETTILALDAQTCAVQRSIQASEPVFWLAVAGITTTSGFQTQLWVAEVSVVSILDQQGQVLDRVPIPGGPRFLCLPGNLTAYVATRQGSVVAVDMLTHQVFASVLKGGSFGSMDFDAVTGEIFVPDQQHNQVDVLSPVLNGAGLLPPEPERVIPVGSSPRAIAVTNDGAFGFVALSGGKVDMLDIPGRQLLATIAVGGEPRFIITGPFPPQGVPVPQSPQSPQPVVSPQAIILPVSLAAALLLGALLIVFLFIRRRNRT